MNSGTFKMNLNVLSSTPLKYLHFYCCFICMNVRNVTHPVVVIVFCTGLV